MNDNRPLLDEALDGYARIAEAAGVTRGAMYHQFADKAALFRAVVERVEEDLIARIGGAMGEVADPWELMVAGTRSFLDACEEPTFARISLQEAPSVLGWQRHESQQRYPAVLPPLYVDMRLLYGSSSVG